MNYQKLNKLIHMSKTNQIMCKTVLAGYCHAQHDQEQSSSYWGSHRNGHRVEGGALYSRGCSGSEDRAITKLPRRYIKTKEIGAKWRSVFSSFLV